MIWSIYFQEGCCRIRMRLDANCRHSLPHQPLERRKRHEIQWRMHNGAREARHNGQLPALASFLTRSVRVTLKCLIPSRSSHYLFYTTTLPTPSSSPQRSNCGHRVARQSRISITTAFRSASVGSNLNREQADSPPHDGEWRGS